MGALASGSLLARMFVFYGAVNLWNNMLFGDDEEKLGTEERLRLHLNLGSYGGEVFTLKFQGRAERLPWMVRHGRCRRNFF